MPRRATLVLLLLAAAGAAALAFWLLRAPLVPAVVLQRAPLQRTLQFSARVATLSRVEVGSTVTGRVARVAVVEGAKVQRGDLLVALESDEAAAALAQARAGERQAAARLAGLRSSGRRGVEAAVAQAESVRVAAAADLQRTQDLVARGFVSASRLDEARRALAVAQAQLASAKAQQAANADQGTDVQQADAQLAQARATHEAAQARLDQATIRAPADGRVLSRLVEPGQIVQPGRALLSMALAGPLLLVAQVDERYLQQLQPGQRASVVADAFPSRRFAARVRTIAPLVDAQRGAVELKFALADDPPPDFLREDMTLSVAVDTARRDAALVLPTAALRRDGGAAAAADTDAGLASGGSGRVLLAVDGHVEPRDVKLGLRTLDAVEVTQGLAAGDTVLLGPAPAPGGRVRVDTSAAAVAKVGGRRGEDAGTALTNAVAR